LKITTRIYRRTDKGGKSLTVPRSNIAVTERTIVTTGKGTIRYKF